MQMYMLHDNNATGGWRFGFYFIVSYNDKSS